MTDAHDSTADAQHSSHAEPAAEAAHAAHGPEIPEVVDEAGNSPSWLPWLGIGLFCLAALVIAGRNAVSKQPAEEGPSEEPTAAEQAGVEVQEPAENAKPEAAPAAAEGH